MAEEIQNQEYNNKDESKKPRRNRRGLIIGIIASPFVLLFIIVLGVRIAQWMTGTRAYVIPSPGMEKTLMIGDRILAGKPADYQPEIGDIIVFKVPDIIPRYDPKKNVYIMRVVALGGDEIEIMEDGSIQVNGRELAERDIFRLNNYYKTIPILGLTFNKCRVPKGEVFVFGDNSGNSFDCRFWGRPDLGKPVVGVPVENIIGKAFYIIDKNGMNGGIVDQPKEIRASASLP